MAKKKPEPVPDVLTILREKMAMIREQNLNKQQFGDTSDKR